MKIPSYKSDDDVKLYDIGDVHRGNIAFDGELLEKVVDEIASDKQAFWVSTGDLLEVALKDSIGDVYSAYSTETEYEYLKEELAPIAHRCLGIVRSNHHRRFEKAVGMSLDKLIARELEVPFLGALGVIRIKCGAAPYYIAMHHGTGGGKMRGGKTNNTQRLAGIMSGCDLYLEGHTHTFDFFIDDHYYIDKKRRNCILYKAHFVVTGHFLTYFDSYGVDAKYKPSPKGVAVATLYARDTGNMNQKKISGDLFD